MMTWPRVWTWAADIPEKRVQSRRPTEVRRIFGSSFSPIQEVGCTACFRVSDTRCGACVILPAFLQSKRSIKQPGGRLPGEQGRYRAADGPGNGWAQRSNR
jgi:hypothetical protein